MTGALCLADPGEYGLTGTDEVAEFSLPGRHPPPLDCVAVADVAGLDTPLLSVIDRMDEHATHDSQTIFCLRPTSRP